MPTPFGRPRAQNWQQRSGAGFYDPEGDGHAVYPTSIVDGREAFDGTVFEIEADGETGIVEALDESTGMRIGPAGLRGHTGNPRASPR